MHDSPGQSALRGPWLYQPVGKKRCAFFCFGVNPAHLWDWSLVADRAARFENLIALHLLKLCHLLQDAEGHAAELRYLRDRSGREVDFLVTVGGKPWFAVEAKLSETRIDPATRYYRDRLAIPWMYQVVAAGGRDFVQDGVRCLPAAQFLAALV